MEGQGEERIGDAPDELADAAGEQWVVWREDDLAAEVEWATAALIGFAALSRALPPAGARTMTPSADELGARTAARRHGLPRGIALRLDHLLVRCEVHLEGMRRRVAALAEPLPAR